jgi:hypothetical protein
MSGVNPLGMSDEEILNMPDPSDSGTGGDDAAQPPQTSGEEPAAVVSPEVSEAAPMDDTDGEGDDDQGEDQDPDNQEDPAPKTPEVVDPVDGSEAKPEGQPVVEKPTTEVAPVTPEAAVEFYNQIMKPFKANGKVIELRSPEEATGLMQMGANYTRKMQELQPFRKTLLMLQNNDLLDPDKLSFFIDLNNGDPEAVKKFIKDRGIDPLDIDTSTDPAYLGGNHHVSDEEVTFQSTLEELRSTPEGKGTLQEVASRWDNASKEVLWKNPEVLPIIQEQRESGVYDVIVAEIDRQRTLGKLRADMPFIEAYKTVGDELVSANGQAPAAPANPNPNPQVLATRVAAPKSAITDSDRANAAAPSRGNAVAPKSFVNPLAMSDDDFLKQMENRV